MRLLALCFTMASAVKLSGEETSMLQMKMTTRRTQMAPHEGFMNPMEHKLTDNLGEMDLDSIIDMDNEPDTNVYPGEDLEREYANDQITNYHTRGLKKVLRHKDANHYNSDDLW